MSDLIDLDSSPKKCNLSFSLVQPLIPSPSCSKSGENADTSSLGRSFDLSLGGQEADSPENNPFDMLMWKATAYEQSREDPYERVLEVARDELIASRETMSSENSSINDDVVERKESQMEQFYIANIKMNFDHLPTSDDDDTEAVDSLIKLSDSPIKEEYEFSQQKVETAEKEEKVEQKSTSRLSKIATLLLSLKGLLNEEDDLIAHKALYDLQKFFGVDLDNNSEILMVCLQNENEIDDSDGKLKNDDQNQNECKSIESAQEKRCHTEQESSFYNANSISNCQSNFFNSNKTSDNGNTAMNITFESHENNSEDRGAKVETSTETVHEEKRCSKNILESERDMSDVIKDYASKKTKTFVKEPSQKLLRVDSARSENKENIKPDGSLKNVSKSPINPKITLKKSPSFKFPNKPTETSTSLRRSMSMNRIINDKSPLASNMRKSLVSGTKISTSKPLSNHQKKPVEPVKTKKEVLNTTRTLNTGKSETTVQKSISENKPSKTSSSTELKNFLLRRTSTMISKVKGRESSNKLNETVTLKKESTKPKENTGSVQVSDYLRDDLRKNRTAKSALAVNNNLTQIKVKPGKKAISRPALSPLENRNDKIVTGKARSTKTVF